MKNDEDPPSCDEKKGTKSDERSLDGGPVDFNTRNADGEPKITSTPALGLMAAGYPDEGSNTIQDANNEKERYTEKQQADDNRVKEDAKKQLEDDKSKRKGDAESQLEKDRKTKEDARRQLALAPAMEPAQDNDKNQKEDSKKRKDMIEKQLEEDEKIKQRAKHQLALAPAIEPDHEEHRPSTATIVASTLAAGSVASASTMVASRQAAGIPSSVEETSMTSSQYPEKQYAKKVVDDDTENKTVAKKQREADRKAKEDAKDQLALAPAMEPEPRAKSSSITVETSSLRDNVPDGMLEKPARAQSLQSAQEYVQKPSGEEEEIEEAQPPDRRGAESEAGEDSLAVAVAVNEDEETPVRHIAQEFDPDAKTSFFRKRRFRLLVVMGGLALLAIVLGVTLGVVLPEDSEAPKPTSPPISDEKMAYLRELAKVSDLVYVEGTSHALAADWIIEQDPRNLTADAKNLVQRFVLTLFYYSTTNNRQWEWTSCNPPSDGEDNFCVFQNFWYMDTDGSYIYRPLAGFVRWLSGEHECQWAGIECDPELLVDKIELWGHNITGTFPSEFEHLASMEIVSLPFNFLSGKFPAEAIGSIQLLRWLELHFNEFTGEIPDSFWSKATYLEALNLGANQLSGTLSTMIGRLTELAGIQLFDNKIAGPIPVELTQLSKMESVFLHRCQFEGPIPTEFGKLTNLLEFRLDGNDLVGTIPSEIGLLTKCENLRIAGTLNRRMQLSGTIPEELYNNTALDTLVLSGNQLAGTLSTRIGNLALLRQFSVMGNNLVGTVPFELANLSRLRVARLQFNQFTGPIPNELCDNVAPGRLEFLNADCGPEGNPAQDCECCSSCCNRVTQECKIQS